MRPLPALALAAALLAGGCTNPDGSLNVPGTLAVGAGAAIAGLAIAAAADDRPRRRDGWGHRPSRGWGHGRPAYSYGYAPPPRWRGDGWRGW